MIVAAAGMNTWVLGVLITVVCVIFGIINWNSGTGEEKK